MLGIWIAKEDYERADLSLRILAGRYVKLAPEIESLGKAMVATSMHP